MRFFGIMILMSLFGMGAAIAQTPDPNSYYVYQGEGVGPWEFALNFGQDQFEAGAAETARGSLVATPAAQNAENDAVHLIWKPKGVKNEWDSENKNVLTATVINRMSPVDLSSVKDQAALAFDVRIIKAPRKPVELTMECNWDWQCRSTVALKHPFGRLPKGEWVTVPVPLRCFDQDGFDFTKVTTSFMLYTGGKMELELGDVRLVAFPADQAKCAGD